MSTPKTTEFISELVVLVDDDGHVTGATERSKMAADERCLAISIWLTNSHGEILVAQRSHTVFINPGLWSVAAEGMVSYGEKPPETAVRELAEELGISVTDRDLTQVPGKILHGSKRGKRYKIGFKTRIDCAVEDLRLQESEVAAVRFWHPTDLVKDWQTHPEKYVAHFGEYLRLFI